MQVTGSAINPGRTMELVTPQPAPVIKQGQAEPETRVPQPTAQERMQQLEEAISRLNQATVAFSTSLQFSIHKEAGEVMVRVVDTVTGEVIREIPPEAVLDAVAKMRSLLGVLLDVKV